MGSASYDSAIEEVKRRLNIIDLIQNYVSLKRSGKDYKGLCPFHDDKNPSMHVSEDKGLFHCFSCGAGGDIFGFMMRYKNLSFAEALEELARMADVDIKPPSHSSVSSSRKKSLLNLNNLVSEYYHKNLLRNKAAEEAREYLKKRGIDLQTAKTFRLGYSFDRWDALKDYLAGKNIQMSYAAELGLLSKRSNSGYYDRFRGRIIFPIFDTTGNVIGFGGRALYESISPKYYNSQESQLYKKRNSFYGLNFALPYIRKENSVLLVEGYFDLITLYSSGMRNVVSTLGTSLTDDHAKILKRYTDSVFIVFDSDSSGISSSLKSGELMLQKGVTPRIVTLPEGYDPDSFIRQFGADEFRKCLQNSYLLPDYIIEKTFEEFRTERISRQKAAEILTEFVSKISSSVERMHYVSRICASFGFRESDIHSMLKKPLENGKRQRAVRSSSERSTREILILKIFLKYPDLKNRIIEDEILELIEDDKIKSVLNVLSFSNDSADISGLYGHEDNDIQDMIAETVFSSDSISDRSTAVKMLNHCIARLRLKKINEELLLLRKRIEESSRNNDTDTERELLAEYRNLVAKEKSVRGEFNES